MSSSTATASKWGAGKGQWPQEWAFLCASRAHQISVQLREEFIYTVYVGVGSEASNDVLMYRIL